MTKGDGENMWKCKYCETDNDVDSDRCLNCGSPRNLDGKDVETIITKTNTVRTTTTETTNKETKQIFERPKPTPIIPIIEPSKPKSRWKLAVGILCISLLIVCAVAYVNSIPRNTSQNVYVPTYLPSPTATATPTPIATPTPTPLPTATAQPTQTPQPTPTEIPQITMYFGADDMYDENLGNIGNTMYILLGVQNPSQFTAYNVSLCVYLTYNGSGTPSTMVFSFGNVNPNESITSHSSDADAGQLTPIGTFTGNLESGYGIITWQNNIGQYFSLNPNLPLNF